MGCVKEQQELTFYGCPANQMACPARRLAYLMAALLPKMHGHESVESLAGMDSGTVTVDAVALVSTYFVEN